MIIIYKCVANKHQKLKNFVLDCNKVNKEKALNKWLYFCKRMVYMYKTVASKLSISHIAWHNKEAWCYMTKTNPIWSMPLQLQLLWQLKYILNELKKLLPWNYQVTNILYIVFFYWQIIALYTLLEFPIIFTS